MIEFRTLEDQSVAQLTEIFNYAFSDYVIKFHLTEEVLAQKIQAENMSLKHSVGAFDGNKLVGFILQGLDTISGNKTAYNAGTGVIPEYRGQKIPQQMYHFILSLLKSEGYVYHQLEVIKGNEKAIKSYQNTGFSISRTFDCYKGVITTQPFNPIEVCDLTQPDWKLLETFTDVLPSWQNSAAAIQRASNSHIIAGAYADSQLIGFGVMDPATGRIKQFGVKKDYRRKGAGTALFHFLHSKSKTGSVNFINYDQEDQQAPIFFKKIGLEKTIEQYEMKMTYT
nr:GNAT family N-acetyltransferase [Pedobacter sp. ASV19]